MWCTRLETSFRRSDGLRVDIFSLSENFNYTANIYTHSDQESIKRCLHKGLLDWKQLLLVENFQLVDNHSRGSIASLFDICIRTRIHVCNYRNTRAKATWRELLELRSSLFQRFFSMDSYFILVLKLKTSPLALISYHSL